MVERPLTPWNLLGLWYWLPSKPRSIAAQRYQACEVGGLLAPAAPDHKDPEASKVCWLHFEQLLAAHH